MSYASASDVAAYCPGLLTDGAFTATTRPTRTQVERYLSSACAMIEGRLQSAGYSTPVPATAAVYDFIVDLEALYAAARAETARLSARIAADERTRSSVFMAEFNRGLKNLLGMDLSRAGLTHSSKLYCGGISKSDKDDVEDDSDRVVPRFVRGQFRYSGTERPSAVAEDEESE